MSPSMLLLAALAALAWSANQRHRRMRPRPFKHHHLADVPPKNHSSTDGRWQQNPARGPFLALAILAAHTDLAAQLQRPPTWALLVGLITLAIYWQKVADLGWTLARRAIAGGQTWLAYHLARISANTWSEDRQGGAVLAAAWASYAKPIYDPDDATWVENKLHALPSLAGAGVVAQGLLAANRGDRDEARQLMLSASSLRNDDTPQLALTIAWDWLMADAAALGNWDEVVRLGHCNREPSPQARFLTVVAARLYQQPSPPDINLIALWFRAGKRRDTLVWRDRALACPRILYAKRQPKSTGAQDDPQPEGTPLQRALARHAQLRREGPVWLRLRPHKLAELVTAWEGVFAGDSLLEHLRRRVLNLEAPLDPAEVLARYRKQVCEDIADYAEAAGLSLVDTVGTDEPESFAAEAIRVLRSRLLVTVEQLCDTLHNRVRGGREKLPIDEWREWTQLRESCEHATKIGGMDARRVLFPQVHAACCAHGVWLWNERKQYALAMPIFRWLLQEAEAVGDEAAIELQRKNAEVKH